MASPRPEPNDVQLELVGSQVGPHCTKVFPNRCWVTRYVLDVCQGAAERKRISNMTNPTPEVTRARGWIKYLAVSCTVLLLAACSSGLETPTPEPELSTQASGCLRGSGKLIILKGTNNRPVVIRNQRNPRVDAGNARFISRGGSGFGIIAARNRGSACISGGIFDTTFGVNASWKHQIHGSNAAYVENSPRVTFENIAVLNSGDAFTAKGGSDGWTFRDSYVKHAGDDAIESDRGSSGRVQDVLVDSTFMGVSCRKEGNRRFERNSLVIEDSLIAMNPRRSAYMFKWTFNTRNPGCVLTLKNNVFLLPKSAGYMDPADHPRVKSRPLNERACRGDKNTIVYTGGNKRYLAQLKKASPACFNVTTDKRVWEKARNAWFKRHSQFSRYR